MSGRRREGLARPQRHEGYAPDGRPPFARLEEPGRLLLRPGNGLTAALVAQAALLAGLAEAAALGGVGLRPAGWVAGLICGVVIDAALAGGLARYRVRSLGPADWVTLGRATLAVAVAALIAGSFGGHAPIALLVSLTALALVLDAVDGWVARRTRTAAALGAHFDAEVDAFLILALSVFVARSAGPWVLAIGAARYLFLVAGWPLPWLRAPLPARFWRKVVAATQGIVLATAAAGVLPPALNRAALLVALALLTESFGRDVWWLWARREAPRRDRGPGRERGRGAGARATAWPSC